ncbi:MAG TPA: S9 family peptidase [Gemmatimonadaceae bacterium]|nr:S9 family peptidase [Gemmatimonadaceae bacterium]
MTRTSRTHWVLSVVGACVAVGTVALAMPAQGALADSTAVRSKDGKRLFGSAEALRVARVSAPRLSTDGSRVAYLVSSLDMDKDKPGKTVTHLWVVPAAGPASAAREYTRGDKSVSGTRWSPDGKIIAFTMLAGEDKDAHPQVWFQYADGGEPWQVTKHKGGVRGFEFSPNGQALLFIAAPAPDADAEKRDKVHDDAVVVDHDLKLAQLWTWDVGTGAEKQITHGDNNVTDAHYSPDGTHVAFTTTPTPLLDDNSMQTAWVLDVASGNVRKLVDTPDYTGTARYSPDGAWIAYLDSRDYLLHQQDLYVVSASGGPGRDLTSKFDLNASEPYWAPDGKTIYFATDTRESNEVFAATVADGSVKQLTTMPGVVDLDAVSSDGKIVIGTRTDPTHPADVYRTDLSFGSLEPITNQNAWLADYALGSTEVITWKSSKDGMEIDGIVTKPVDFAASRKYPALLNPHGGPTGASLLGFNPSDQIMAANGYVVLEPNFRGSTGRGEAFATANQNDWGGGDYRDDMSGVDALLARGWADPARLGAFGWSYGGFMTFWIDTQTDRFKAISPGAGLPDLYSMYSQTDIHRYLRQFFNMKAPWDNFQEYWDHSPMKFVNNVKTPTMILHGQADTRVPIPQAEEFFRALTERHVPVEFVTYPRENHGFTEPRHMQDRYQRYLVFFGKYLNNPPVTEPRDVIDRMSKDLPAQQVATTKP